MRFLLDGWKMKILLVMLGGGLGALSRYGVTILSVKLFGSKFPWGTLIVNLSGCFLIGLAYALSDRTNLLSPSTRLLFMTGYLGALTTFSTYALETVNAFQGTSAIVATANFLSNNIFGAALVILGMWIGRLV
jgi:fluoride exporter